MGADENTSTVAEDVSTSVPAETVESTPTQEPVIEQPAPVVEEPRTADDVWESMGEETETQESEKPEPETEAEKPAEEAEKEDKQEGEKTAEEEALEEAFADESEKKPDETEEELSKMTEAEMLERQRNKHSRDWAERNAKKAETVKRFQFEDTPIAEVANELKEISAERYEEFSQYAAHSLVDANPDATFQRAYAVKMLQKDPSFDLKTAKLPTLDEVMNGATPAQKPSTSPPPAELQEVTAALDSTLGWDWRNPELDENFVDERELAMVKTIRALETKATESSKLVNQNKELEAKLQGLSEGVKTAEQEKLETELHREVNEFRGDLEKTILPFIAKTNGLEISPDDTPEIRAFKQNRMVLFTGTEYDKANGYPSQFESFAYNESTVRNELETISKRVVAATIKKVQAHAAGDAAGVDKYQREIADEKLPMSQLLGQANKEFKAKFIAPDLALIGMLSSKLAEPRKEASERIEVVSNGSATGAQRPKPKSYETADDVWGAMVTDAAEEEKLRANA